MSDGIHISGEDASITPNASINRDIPKNMQDYLGEGHTAQITVIYRVIRWSFISSGILIVLLVIMNLVFNWPHFDNNFFFEGIKNIWAITGPLITLALGYLCGKRE